MKHSSMPRFQPVQPVTSFDHTTLSADVDVSLLSKRRRATCRHEAGHALARWYFGHYTDRAVVLTQADIQAGRWLYDHDGIECTNNQGVVFGYGIHNPPYGLNKFPGEIHHFRIASRDQALIALWAGIAAEATYRKCLTMRCWFESGIGDIRQIRQILEGWFTNIDDQNATESIAWRRSVALVRSKPGADAIAAMTDALMVKGEIDGDEIKVLCRAAYGGREPAFGSWDSHWPPTITDLRAGVIHERAS